MFRSLLADPRGLAAPTFEEAVDALRRYLHDARELTQNHGVSCSIALGLLRHVPLSTAIETVGRCPHLKDRSLADRVENFPEPINIMALVAVLEDPCIQKLGVSHSFAIQFARRKDYSERLVLFHRIVELYPDWRVSFCAKIALANEPHEGLQLAGELVSVYRASVTSACEFVTSTGSRAAIAGLKEAYERIHPHGYSMTNALSLWRKREGLARADALGLATQLLPAGTKRTSLQIVRAAAHPATLLETLRVLEKEGQPLSLSVLRAIAKHPEVTPHSSAVVTLLADGLTAQEALAIATSANPSAARALILEAREAKLSDPRGRARLAFYPRPVERHALVRALSRYYSPKMPKPAEVAKILESADPQKMTSIIALAAERRISLSCFELQRLGRRPQPERCFAAFDKFPNLGLTPSQIADLILLRDIEGGLANVVRLREKFPPIGLSHAVRMACSRDPGKAEAALAELLRTDSRSMNISTLVLIACKGEQVVFDGPRAPLAPHTTKASVPLLALSNPADRMALAAAAQQFKHLHLSSTLANYLMRSSRYQHDFEQLRQLDACTGKQRIMEREIRFLLRHSVQGLADELWRLGFDAPPPASGLSEAQIRQIRFMKLCSKLPRGIAFVTNALPTDSAAPVCNPNTRD